MARAYPEEGCGVLIGRDEGEARRALEARSLGNALEDSRGNRYLISPEQLLAADRDARALGLEVVGFFHSHPDHPARPSAYDLEHAWPYYSYVIVSVSGGRVVDTTCWRLREDRSRFDPEPIELVREGVGNPDARGADEESTR
jgi:proteasome lid subunit RPN8/RPN11